MPLAKIQFVFFLYATLVYCTHPERSYTHSHKSHQIGAVISPTYTHHRRVSILILDDSLLHARYSRYCSNVERFCEPEGKNAVHAANHRSAFE